MSGTIAIAEAVSGAVAGALGLNALAGALGAGGFASFGPVSFALLGSPQKITRTRRSNFAKVPVIGAAPALQWIYDDLEQVTIGFLLHGMWCVPDQALALLDAARTAHQPEPLVFGMGISLGSLLGAATNQVSGQYVITQLDASDTWRPAGVGQCIEGTLTLSEWQPTLPLGAAPVQPTQPTPGIIGLPPGLGAIYVTGATLGVPLPSLTFASVAVSAIARIGAP